MNLTLEEIQKRIDGGEKIKIYVSLNLSDSLIATLLTGYIVDAIRAEWDGTMRLSLKPCVYYRIKDKALFGDGNPNNGMRVLVSEKDAPWSHITNNYKAHTKCCATAGKFDAVNEYYRLAKKL